MRNNKFVSFSLGLVVSAFSMSVYADVETPDIQWEENSDSRVAMIDNKHYEKLCGSCHEAYAAGLLPPQSWEKIVLGLNDHFGKKIELEQSDVKEILNYLLGNAAGRSQYVLSSRMITGLKDVPPTRITQLPFFVDKHKAVKGNLGACSACHTQVSKGSFDKKEIKQP